MDVLFYLLGIFCYLAILTRFKENNRRYNEYVTLAKKRQAYSNHMLEEKRREFLARKTEERKKLNQPDYQAMASTVEFLSDMSDKEVMRKSRVAGSFSGE
jgi:hypothetical protein